MAQDTAIDLIKLGYKIMLKDIVDLTTLKPHYFLFDIFDTLNVINDQYIKQLANLFNQYNVKFILNNVSKIEQIANYEEVVKLFIGNIYKNKFSYFDICNLYK